jgi:hypothetical protein
LAFGLARGEFRDYGILAVEIGGAAALAILAALALALGGAAGAYVLAAAWFGHAAWDVVHHRMNRVVPQAYAEACAVADAIVAVAILTTA